MTTTEMEERVARALDAVIDGWYDGKTQANLNTTDLARAAIRAMRDPTTEMLREAGMVVAGNTEAHAAVWETLIDAASPQEE